MAIPDQLGNINFGVTAANAKLQIIITRLDEIEKKLDKPAEPAVGCHGVSYSKLEALFEDLFKNRKVPAIKCIRELTGCGLKDAVDLINKYF